MTLAVDRGCFPPRRANTTSPSSSTQRGRQRRIAQANPPRGGRWHLARGVVTPFAESAGTEYNCAYQTTVHAGWRGGRRRGGSGRSLSPADRQQGRSGDHRSQHHSEVRDPTVRSSGDAADESAVRSPRVPGGGAPHVRTGAASGPAEVRRQRLRESEHRLHVRSSNSRRPRSSSWSSPSHSRSHCPVPRHPARSSCTATSERGNQVTTPRAATAGTASSHRTRGPEVAPCCPDAHPKKHARAFYTTHVLFGPITIILTRGNPFK